MDEAEEKVFSVSTAGMVGMLRQKMIEEVEGHVPGEPSKRAEVGWGPLVVRTPGGSAIAQAAAQSRFRARMARQTGWKNTSFVIDDTSANRGDLGEWLTKQRERYFGTTPRWVATIGAQNSGLSNRDVWTLPVPAIHLGVDLTLWNIEEARRDVERAKHDGSLPPDLIAGIRQLCRAVESVSARGSYTGRIPVLLCTVEELSIATAWFRQSAGTWVEALRGLMSTEAMTASLATISPNAALMPWLKAYKAVRILPRTGERTFIVQPPSQRILQSSSQELAYEAELGEALSALPASWRIPSDARRELLLSPDGVVREQAIRRLAVESRKTETSERISSGGR